MYRVPLSVLLLWAFALPLVCGCGSSTYGERLAHTVEYFKFEEKLNKNLKRSQWSGGGVKLRVPLQMTEIPAPEEPEDDKPRGRAPDERQLRYLQLELPGLEGAWTADVEVESEIKQQPEPNRRPPRREPGDENETTPETDQEPDDDNKKTNTVPAYIYVFSNYNLFNVEESEDTKPTSAVEAVIEAQEYSLELPWLIANALRLGEPQESDYVEERFPFGGQASFVPRKSYDTLSITLGPHPHFKGVKTDFTLYKIQDGDIQAIILSVIPQGISPQERLDDRIQMMLGTVKMEKRAPSGGGSSSKSGGANF